MSLLASGSYTMPFVIMSRTIGVFFVKKEPSCWSLWQVNNVISPKRNVFNKVHTIQIFKSTIKCIPPHFGRIIQVCSRWCGNRHTHTHSQNNYCNLAHVPRLNNRQKQSLRWREAIKLAQFWLKRLVETGKEDLYCFVWHKTRVVVSALKKWGAIATLTPSSVANDHDWHSKAQNRWGSSSHKLYSASYCTPVQKI